ncbi:E3 ubiquitin-protein ligase DCST1-like [Mantella aurantiaca]
MDHIIQPEDDDKQLQGVIVQRADEDVKPVSRKKKARKPKPRTTTFRHYAESVLPNFCSNFLFSNSNEFTYSRIFFGISTGGLLGFATYLLLIDPLIIPDIVKVGLLYILSGIFAYGWGFSPHFRCTTLIIVPNILGKEGRAYLLIFVLAAIYAGPGANLQHNFGEIPRVIGCTAELQINNTKLLWKIISMPVKNILKNVVHNADEFKNIGNEVKSSFKDTKNEVESKSGYDVQKEEELHQGQKISTQKMFDFKNILRCEYIIELGITKCYEWFEKKHAECMRTIAVPIINHLLCIPMQFSFLCNILTMGVNWCKKHVPIDVDFGEMYDKVNSSVTNVGSGISSKLSIEKEENVGAGENITTISMKDKILAAIEKRRVIMDQVTVFLKHIIGISFIFVFLTAFKYSKQYISDIRHDNCCVTTYFRQIDARRRKQKKRYLLPMKKGELSKFIFPFSPVIQGPERYSMMTELRQCIIPILALSLMACFDKILFHVLDIIRRHSNITYVFASHHKLEVVVEGNSLIATILRKTIGLLNSSSNTFETSNNEMCLPKPIEMTYIDYFVTCLPVFGLICLSILQVYFYRLRRVAASYYFPKREKRRVLFLYNEQLRKRATYADVKRKQIMHKARVNQRQLKTTMGAFYLRCKWLRKYIRRHCIVCDQSETKESYLCPTPDCGTVYCRQCWRDMERFCFVCKPYEKFILGPDNSDSERGSD